MDLKTSNNFDAPDELPRLLHDLPGGGMDSGLGDIPATTLTQLMGDRTG